jgi:ABC-type sugar transport system permease subunit
MSIDLETRTVTPARPARGARRWLRRTLHKPQFWFGSAVLIPTLLWYTIFQFGPVIESFYFSFVYVRILDLLGGRFIGLGNYTQLLDAELNPNFGPAALNTVIWTAVQFVIVVPLALLLATCLTTITRGRTFFQVVFFLPVITPLVVIGLIMERFFDPQVGLANEALQTVGVAPSQWLHDPIIALPLAASIGAWRWLGLYTVLLTAGMLNIPRDVRDAARVDGAESWTLFRRITLPLLGHIMVLVLILLLVNSVQEYTLPNMLSTQTTDLEMINGALEGIAFGSRLQIGVGAAGGALECVVTLVISLLILRIFRPKWSY